MTQTLRTLEQQFAEAQQKKFPIWNDPINDPARRPASLPQKTLTSGAAAPPPPTSIDEAAINQVYRPQAQPRPGSMVLGGTNRPAPLQNVYDPQFPKIASQRPPSLPPPPQSTPVRSPPLGGAGPYIVAGAAVTFAQQVASGQPAGDSALRAGLGAAFGAIGGLLGGAAGSALPGAGTAAGAFAGSALGGALGAGIADGLIRNFRPPTTDRSPSDRRPREGPYPWEDPRNNAPITLPAGSTVSFYSPNNFTEVTHINVSSFQLIAAPEAYGTYGPGSVKFVLPGDTNGPLIDVSTLQIIPGEGQSLPERPILPGGFPDFPPLPGLSMSPARPTGAPSPTTQPTLPTLPGMSPTRQGNPSPTLNPVRNPDGSPSPYQPASNPFGNPPNFPPNFPTLAGMAPGGSSNVTSFFAPGFGNPPNSANGPNCEDPCLSDIGSMLSDLLDQFGNFAGENSGQPGAEPAPTPTPKTKTITVPIASCQPNGTVSYQQQELEVPVDMADSLLLQFVEIAAVKAKQCAIDRHTERSHNILGGAAWFEDASDRTPLLNTTVESQLKSRGTAQGFHNGAETPTDIHNIRELIEAYLSTLYHRGGYHGFPATVPQSLLTYSDQKDPVKLKDAASYFTWYIQQFDALVGQFPIEITIEDADPATKGQQKKVVELPNISEALAELYGLATSGTTNSDIIINILSRVAVETVAAKNAALIGQDYSKANASFLGYKGNAVERTIMTAFNPTKFDTLDEFLANTKTTITGWEEQDPETVVGFLQRIVFSAGIIKAVFFRDKKRLKEIANEVESLLTKDRAMDDQSWDRFINLINDPGSQFNTGENPQPRVDRE